jgi:hypothetical protein
MKQLNTIPIENYLDKARIAAKSGQRVVTLDILEATELANSLAVVMTRISGELDTILQAAMQNQPDTEVSMDGGTF